MQVIAFEAYFFLRSVVLPTCSVWCRLSSPKCLQSAKVFTVNNCVIRMAIKSNVRAGIVAARGPTGTGHFQWPQYSLLIACEAAV